MEGGKKKMDELIRIYWMCIEYPFGLLLTLPSRAITPYCPSGSVLRLFQHRLMEKPDLLVRVQSINSKGRANKAKDRLLSTYWSSHHCWNVHFLLTQTLLRSLNCWFHVPQTKSFATTVKTISKNDVDDVSSSSAQVVASHVASFYFSFGRGEPASLPVATD